MYVLNEWLAEEWQFINRYVPRYALSLYTHYSGRGCPKKV